MSRVRGRGWVLLPLAALAACAQTPLGPTVQAMPGPRKSFEAFQLDGAGCQQYAQSAVQGQAERANTQAVGGAVLGTVLGAGLGAAIGGGRGAGIGAASGAVLGTAGGAGYSANVQGGIQAQYDNAYGQCMWSHGNRVAGMPEPEGPQRVAQPYRRAPVRQAVRAAPATSTQSAGARADWVAPASASSGGGAKAPMDAGWVKPVQGQ